MDHTQLNSDEISLIPFKREFQGYSWDFFRGDVLAALSVALLTVPQSMAYALLAGLPLSTGLFAAIFSSLIAAIFGSSRHLIIGPSNSIAILMQAGTAEILYNYYRNDYGIDRDMMALQILTQLTLLIGVIQVLAANFKLGRLTQFVSHSVVVGYITGTALAVMINQSFTFLGIENNAAGLSIYEKCFYFFTHLNQIHIPTATIGGICLLALIIIRRLDKRIPAALITLGLAALTIFLLSHLSINGMTTEGMEELYWENISLIGDQGSLENLWPNFAFPYFDISLINHLLPVAFAIALLSIMETTSVAKTISASSGQRLDINQEIFGLGLGNLFSSFICAMPVSASPSRSNINYSTGAHTRMAAILNVVFVATLLYSFSFIIMQIPLAALSALLLVTAIGIVQPKQFFLCLKATNSDAFVLLMTLLSCIFLSLDIAFYIGVIVSITLYLKKSAVPQLIEYDIDDEGELSKSNTSTSHEHKTIRVIKVEGELFFGAADIFQTTLKAIAEDDTNTKVIILQLKNARDIDATVCLALNQLYDYLKNSGRHLVACGMLQQVWDVLSDSGMVEVIGKKNLFIFEEKHPHKHMIKAHFRARELVKTESIIIVETNHSVVLETLAIQDPVSN